MHRAVPLFLLTVSLVGAWVGYSGGGGGSASARWNPGAGIGRREGDGVSAAELARIPTLPRGGTSFRFPTPIKDDPRGAATDRTPPFSLTATDGTGLALVALDARGVLEPPLAFTELHLTFENPRDRVIEGRFRVALPPGAALSRFAMKLDSGWQEGEVVERQRARVAYEDFLHRRQDPALLEQEAANEFSARVFPIPARGRKEIVVSWSHALVKSDEPYVLPLLGLPEVGALDASVLLGERAVAGGAATDPDAQVSDRRVVELHKQGWTPDRDLVIAQERVAERSGLRHENLAVVRVAAPVEARPREIGGLFVLLDSSASRALGYEAQVKRLAELVAGLRDGAGAGTPLAVAAFDQEVAPLFEGTAGEFGDAVAQRLLARRALGASDLAGALGWLDSKLRASGGRYPSGRYDRVLLITDGVATAGDTETASLRAAVHALGARGVERLDVLATGGLRDDAVLHELVTGNLAHDGQRLDGRAPLAELARRLTLACRSGIAVEVDGASWTWPERLDGVQPGDEALVFADLPTEKPLRVTLDGRPAALRGEVVSAERPLLQRAWAQARIERLVHLRDVASPKDEDLRRALTLQVTQLSVENRVLSPFTALLVLETEWDYQRFGIDRRSLADVLTVGPAGLEVLARSTPSMRPPTMDVAAAKQARARNQAPAQPAAPQGREDSAAGSAGWTNDQIVVTGESPLLDERRIATGATVSADELANIPTEPEQLQALGYLGNPEPASGVEGGVSGSVPGGVHGGVPGGVVSGVAPPPPPPPPPPAPPRPTIPAPEEVPAVEAPARIADAQRNEPGAFGRQIGQRDARARGGNADAQRDGADEPADKSPYEGRFAEVMAKLAAGKVVAARTLAETWNDESPGDVLALLALGETWEAAGDQGGAARAYGSLIDLFPSRADLRRLAGERLERLGDVGLTLTVDTYEKAVAQRPDHPSSHRLLAWALLRAGRPADAFAALERGIEQRYPSGRFAGVERVLQDDLGMLGAAWLRAEPTRRNEVLGRLRHAGAQLDDEPSLRFVLSWETDANDVDLHVFDRKGGHAYYSAKELPSGGSLYADVTTGYGPECFTVPRPNGTAAPYHLKVHYYSRGPMGYGMGTVQVIAYDGHGGLRVEPRPFVVMIDQAMVDMGSVDGPKDVRAGK